MPRRANALGIKELHRRLAAKERQLAKALAKRETLGAPLEALDAEIAALGGGGRPRRNAASRERSLGRSRARPGRRRPANA